MSYFSFTSYVVPNLIILLNLAPASGSICPETITVTALMLIIAADRNYCIRINYKISANTEFYNTVQANITSEDILFYNIHTVVNFVINQIIVGII